MNLMLLRGGDAAAKRRYFGGPKDFLCRSGVAIEARKRMGPVQGDRLGWGLGAYPKLGIGPGQIANDIHHTGQWGPRREAIWRCCEIFEPRWLEK